MKNRDLSLRQEKRYVWLVIILGDPGILKYGLDRYLRSFIGKLFLYKESNTTQLWSLLLIIPKVFISSEIQRAAEGLEYDLQTPKLKGLVSSS